MASGVPVALCPRNSFSPSVEYRARAFFKTPLYRLLREQYGRFQEVYCARFEEEFGFFRSSVDGAVRRFSICGDPREGVAVFTCEACSTRRVVAFSCKTRLFCPTCHQRKLLVWTEDLVEHVLFPVDHRFWTFTIPKRLRPYFRYDRKLLSVLVAAAHRTFSLTLGNGRIRKNLRPALITLIQTHGDELNWQSHLHILAADGAFETGNPAKIQFHRCSYWNREAMAEIFRKLVVTALHRKGVLSDDVATNLMSWPHSGFHVHASDPFPATDKEQVTRRLAYAFRVPVSLKQLTYERGEVTLRTHKGNTLRFEPMEFLAHLTLHIPDRYQHYRRYFGLYAPATRVFLGLDTKTPTAADSQPLRVSWAKLIARIFGDLPTKCPNCQKEMKLQGFELKLDCIRVWVPELARAPPQIPFVTYRERHRGRTILAAAEGPTPYIRDSLSQLRKESNDDFDQTIAW